MKINNFKFLIIILLLVTSCLLPVGKVNAQIFQSITISPPISELNLKPSQSANGIINISNNSKEDLFFTSRARDFIVEDDKGTPIMLDPDTLSNKYSASSWIAIDPPAGGKSFTVKPGERKPIQYTINVPKDARPGGHYASILFTSTPQNNSALQNSASVQTEIGSLISIVIAGPIVKNAVVSKFLANSFQEYGPVKIDSQITNQSDIHISPQGTITITDMLNRTIDSQILPIKRIFPQAKKNYENSFGTKLMIGRFKAVLNATYADNLPLQASFYFWIIPWEIIAIIILLIITLILGFQLWRRKKNLVSNEPPVME